MTKRKRTNKSKYKHESTGEYCTCAAYIAELLCLKHAEYKNVGSLPYKFWNTKAWKWTYTKQMILANKMLKKFSEAGMVMAIKSKEWGGIFSLKNKRCLSIIRKYDKITQENLDKIQSLEVVEQPVSRKASFGKRSMISKLRSIELDGEKKKTGDKI